MSSAHEDAITGLAAEARFFLEPETTRQRQYEALRAYFVEGASSTEAAERFGYTAGSFRVLCHRFRHDPEFRGKLFAEVQRGPSSAPVRDEIRELAVAMRKRNLSIYDIQRELRQAGHETSINTIWVLLREEGFSRLPRRRDEERPPSVKPEQKARADVRKLDLAPRQFRTRVAGLLLFVPLMRDIDLDGVVEAAGLPGSRMMPPLQAVRSALALKLIGKERKSHVMDLVEDQGLALFAGLNVVPKRSYLAAYSSRLDAAANFGLMSSWFGKIEDAGLERSGSLDLDFHSVPANTEVEPLEKHYVSRRSRREKGILTFLARDAGARVICYANASVTKSGRAGEVLRFAEFWKQQTGSWPTELVFDSQLTTYANLRELDARGIRFLTLRRRSKKMLARIYSLPPSAWTRVTLESLSRKYRTPRVLDEEVDISNYGDTLRQLTIIELGHEEPTLLLTNNRDAGAAALITRYAQRMLIENGIAEAVQFFHLDALSSMVGLKIDFDLQLTLMASSLYRLLAERLPDQYRRAQAKTIFRNLLDVAGKVSVHEDRVVLSVDNRTHNPFLASSGLTDAPTPMPWFGNKPLFIEFA